MRWSAWNLLLLVPFLMLVTPWFNSMQPRLFGLPFFYWSQFAFVPVGVVCVAVVHIKTVHIKTVPTPTVAAITPAPDVDELDEGTRS